MVASFSLYHSSSSISKNPLSVLLLAHADRYKAEHKVYTSFLDKDLSCTHTHIFETAIGLPEPFVFRKLVNLHFMRTMLNYLCVCAELMETKKSKCKIQSSVYHAGPGSGCV